MATTPNLGLPLIDGAMTADVPRDMNALANAVDTAVEAAIDEAVAAVTIPDASLTAKGKVQLSNATSSTSQLEASTPKAVNDARIAAISAAATDATTKANTAEANAKSYVDAKTWQKHKLTQDNGLSVSINNGNANNLILNGNYVGVNISNAPTTGNSTTDIWYIRVSALSSVWIKQEAFNLVNDTYQTRTGRDNGNLQVVWQPWSPDVFQSGVDAKQGVVNAINAKGGSASMSDTWAQLAAKINAIQTGPKYATGIASTGDTTVKSIFTRKNGETQSLCYITVTGLTFRPNRIIFRVGESMYVYSYNSRNAGIGGYNLVTYDPNSSLTDFAIRMNELSGTSVVEGGYVNNSGFRVPYASANTQVTWEAFGV